MYFIVVSVGASVLLVSSVITIVILLTKQFKQWINTPLYILSISDILFSIFTSGVLLINCTEKIPYTNFDKENSTVFLNSSTWDKDIKLEQMEFKKIEETNLNIIPECNIINIIMKYGMLFFPFTNSFVSLLMFSIQCNLSVFSLKSQCSKLLLYQEKMYESDNDINKHKPYNMEKCERPVIHNTFKKQIDSVFKLMESEKLSIIKEKLIQTLKCSEIKKGKKVISILLVSQWIIPIFIIGILYLAEYDNRNYVKDMENVQCFTKNNFFSDKCYNNNMPMNIIQKVTSIAYPTNNYKDYIGNNDLIKSSDTNDTEVNEVISRVQNIVNIVLNETSIVQHNMDLDNAFEMLNTTKYLKPNTRSEINGYKDPIKNKTNSIQNIPMTWYKAPHIVTNFQDNISLQNNNMQTEHNINNYNKELVLFNYVTTNSSTVMPVKENNMNQITNSTAKKEQSQKLQAAIKDNQHIISEENKISVVSDNQIDAEIHKQNITLYYNIKNDYENNSEYQEMLKQNIINDVQYNYTSSDQNELSVIKIIIYKNDNSPQIIQLYVTNKCYISIRFLRLHLFVFIFVIYFLPILFSSILHQRGRLNCQIVLEKLKTKNEVLSNNIKSNLMKKITHTESIESTISKQDSQNTNENFEESINNCVLLKEIEISHTDHSKTSNKQYEHDEEYHVPVNREKLYLNTINQVKNILKLFDMIKISLLYGILLWTPIFLEILLKIFMLFNIPEWLINITYLSATMFGLLRNIFNVKMIKLQEINKNIIKTNTIYPTV